MKYILTLLFSLLVSTVCYAQSKDSIALEKYLDDQLYISITYNTLYDLPSGISQNGFSNGIFFGYIKDIPINKARNFGFGLGLGYGTNRYFQNLKIEEENGETTYEEVSSFDRNKFSFHTIDVPIEVRWRTSTSTKYKFWRIYTGMKLSYVIGSNAELRKNGTIKVKGIEDINKFQYGLTLGAGFGTWNLNVYYGLNTIFSSSALMKGTNTPVNGREFRVGFIFYIL